MNYLVADYELHSAVVTRARSIDIELSARELSNYHFRIRQHLMLEQLDLRLGVCKRLWRVAVLSLVSDKCRVKDIDKHIKI